MHDKHWLEEIIQGKQLWKLLEMTHTVSYIQNSIDKCVQAIQKRNEKNCLHAINWCAEIYNVYNHANSCI